MSLLEILNTRQEWDPLPTCPACGHLGRFEFTFTLARTLRDSKGRLSIDVGALGETDPHLVVACSNCGADWEMECRTS